MDINKYIVVFLILVFCSGFNQPPTSPFPIEDWRYPSEKDYKGDWKEFRNKSRQPFYTSADFNGDGMIDQAWILIFTKETGWGLFVFLRQKDEGYKMILR